MVHEDLFQRKSCIRACESSADLENYSGLFSQQQQLFTNIMTMMEYTFRKNPSFEFSYFMHIKIFF